MTENTIIPVALFAYSRPVHLTRTLEGLKVNRVPLIYAFCDGPRDDSKVEQVKKVREILHNVDWTTILIAEQESNLGLGTSIRLGVTKVLESFDKVIVIEDDIVMRPGAYDYTCSALNYYEKDERIMTVSMWSYPSLNPKNSPYGFFSERFVCWGWGTYKKYWSYYDKNPDQLYYEAIKQRNDLLLWGKDLKTQALTAEIYNLWYVGYVLCHFIHNKISYLPSETLIINIGRDAQATHTKSGLQDNLELIEVPVTVPKKWPYVFIDKNTNRKFRNYFDYKNKCLIRRTLEKISKLNDKIISKIFCK